MKVTVLFEDRAAHGDVKNFGPGSLLRACVADLLGVEVWSLRERLHCIPVNGNSKVLRRCRDEAALHPLPFACIDADRVADLLGLSASATCADLQRAWRAACPAMPTGQVVLLDRNVETLVGLAASVLGERAPTGKDPLNRDRLLNRLAFSAEHVRRDALLGRSPSFARLVHHVAQGMGRGET